MRVLVVEDEAELGALVSRGLTRAGLATDLATSIEEAECARRIAGYDLMILDLGLPDGDGLDLLRRMRTNGEDEPVLVLTARDAIEDRVAGLDAGADDYVLKPFAMAELIARVKALLRRPARTALSRLACGNLAIDTARRSAEVDGAPTLLTRREFSLLEALMRSENRVVGRESLEDQLYSIDQAVGPNALEVVVHRLRRRLAEAGAQVQIHTVRGIGYMLAAE